MDDFPKLWMTDICNELNSSGFEMEDLTGVGKFDISRLNNSPIDLMKTYVTYNADMYEHLNSKGLVNRGYCPITGEKIGTNNLYQFFERKVYLSEAGKKLAKEWDRREYIKLYGKEPISEKQKFKESREYQPVLSWAIIIVIVMLILKKCL